MAVIDRFLRLNHGFLGKFIASADDPGFVTSGPAKGHLIVFPREEVAITQGTQRPFVANSTNVVLYNRGIDYRRHVIAEIGDHCDFLDVEDDVIAYWLKKVLGQTGTSWQAEQPFAVSIAVASSRLFQTQGELFDLAHNSGDVEQINRLVHSVLEQVVACTARTSHGIDYQTCRDEHWRLVFQAQRLICKDYAEPLTTERIARSLGVSRFHLCRIFRQNTGTTIHRYLNNLRLRKSTALLRYGKLNITSIAPHIGYSSHSHFSSSFRESFRMTPQQWRELSRTRQHSMS